MENLNPTLRLIMSLREGLEKGESPRQSLQNFIQTETGPLAENLKLWWIQLETRSAEPPCFQLTRSQKATVNLIQRSFQGESIGAGLALLQQEVTEKCENQIEAYVQGLPLRSLLPLIFLIFPAYLLILLGPLVEELIHSINH